jgi:5-methylcytosine-specific restriction endonuclease McrA
VRPRKTTDKKIATAIVKRMPMVCHLCGGPIDPSLRFPDPASLTVDHVVPVSRGGNMTDAANLRPAHFRCNRLKSDRLPPMRHSREW